MPKLPQRLNGELKAPAAHGGNPSQGNVGGRAFSNGRVSLAQYIAAARDQADVVIGSGLLPDEGEVIEGTTMDVAMQYINSVKYLVPGLIPYGMPTGIIAPPGFAKSALALWLARSIMTGWPWFNGMLGPKPGYVIWCATENDMGITKQRMEKWKIPPQHMVLPFEGKNCIESIDIMDPAELRRVEILVNKYKARALFVDSLRGAHATDENSSHMAQVVGGLAAIAERTKAACILTHHTKKIGEEGRMTAESSRGSNAIVAMMRCVIGIDEPNESPDPLKRHFRVRVLKDNLGIAPKPVGFRFTDVGLEFGEPPEKQRHDHRKQAAENWLRSQLADGEWHLALDLRTAARDFGFSENALQRAREALGITVEQGYIRQRDDARSEWKLPPPALISE